VEALIGKRPYEEKKTLEVEAEALNNAANTNDTNPGSIEPAV
jgi:hypothetical protein